MLIMSAISTTVSASESVTESIKAPAIAHSLKSARTSIPGLTVDDAIRTAPKGKVTKLSRDGDAYYGVWAKPVRTNYMSVAGELVECDNGDVYLKDAVSMLPTGLYIKGRKDGKSLVFDLPQVAYIESYYGELYPYKLTTLIYSNTDNSWYPVNSEKAKELNLPVVEDKFVINIKADGTYHFTTPKIASTMVGLVMVNDDSWSAFAEIESTWSPISAETVTPPATIETADIIVHSNDKSHYAKCGIIGDDVYAKGLFSTMPDAWIKGCRDGKKLTFASSQYMGIEPKRNIHTYFSAANYVVTTNPITGQEVPGLEYTDKLSFEYNDNEAAYIALANQAATLNVVPDKISYIEYLLNPKLQWLPEDMSYNPGMPEIIDYDYSDKYGDLRIRFILPTYNENGILLNKDNIKFCFHVDEKIFVFTPDDYRDFDEDVTEIPYDIRTYDIEYIPEEGYHQVFFYFGEKPVGVQSLYYIDGKKVGESKIAVAKSAGVDLITADRVIESEEYYSIDGRPTTDPAPGIYIKVIKYTDGTHESVKCVVK